VLVTTVYSWGTILHFLASIFLVEINLAQFR